MFYDFSTSDDQEWLVNKILGHKWDKNHLSFHIQWNMGDTTWEPYEACKNLQALDDYLWLLSVKKPSNLPRDAPS